MMMRVVMVEEVVVVVMVVLVMVVAMASKARESQYSPAGDQEIEEISCR